MSAKPEEVAALVHALAGDLAYGIGLLVGITRAGDTVNPITPGVRNLVLDYQERMRRRLDQVADTTGDGTLRLNVAPPPPPAPAPRVNTRPRGPVPSREPGDFHPELTDTEAAVLRRSETFCATSNLSPMVQRITVEPCPFCHGKPPCGGA